MLEKFIYHMNLHLDEINGFKNTYASIHKLGDETAVLMVVSSLFEYKENSERIAYIFKNTDVNNRKIGPISYLTLTPKEFIDWEISGKD